MTKESLQTFMFESDPIQSLIENAEIYDHNVEVAVTHVLKYWDAMNAIEKRFASESKPDLQSVIAAKTEAHDLYWIATEDDYWKPCSHGNNEEFRVTDIAEVFALSDFRSSFVVRVVIRSDADRLGKSDIVYLLQTEDGSDEGPLKIVNQFN